MPKTTAKKSAEKIKVKRPAHRYALFGLWFSAISAGVVILGAILTSAIVLITMLILSLNSGDERLTSNMALLSGAISAITFVFILYFTANSMKRKKHTLARWTRKSLNVLAILAVIPLLAVLYVADTTSTQNSNETATTSTPTQNTISPVTNNEERRYQYMYCSNGTYRYYTDEEFKNPNTGFTANSPDYCAQNNQGMKTQLADAPPRNQQAAKPTRNTTPSYELPNSYSTQPQPEPTAIAPAICDEELEFSYIQSFDRESMGLLRQWANETNKSIVAQRYIAELNALTNSTNLKLESINCPTRVRAPAVSY